MTGCSSTEQVGAVDVCFNEQGERGELDDDDNFSSEAFGVRLVGAEESVAAPDGRDCRDFAAHAELVDADGRHLWVGASANAGAQELISAEAFAGLELGSLQASSASGFSSFQFLQLDNDDGTPVIALGAGFDVDRGPGRGSIVVDEGGATALPSFVTCGPVTTKSLDFTSDDGRVLSLHNGDSGDSGAIVVAGVDVVATNIWSADYSTNCKDAPSGFEATWVVTRAP